MMNKIQKNMTPLERIKTFVQEGFTKNDLERELYDNHEMINFLEQYQEIPNRDEVNAYQYIVEQNFNSKGNYLNFLQVFEMILEQENVSFVKNGTIEEEIDFISNATPSWIPDHIPYVSKLYDENKPLAKKEFKDLLIKHFKCMKKKPKWIQYPDWIIEEAPLIFVGQMDVSSLHHDTTYLYTFFNPINRTYHYLTQSM